jgi:hypothetical protein
VRNRADQVREGRLHNWHRNVPTILTKPGPRWSGTDAPTSSSDPKWKALAKLRDEFHAKVLDELAVEWNQERLDRRSDKLYADLALHLLELFPAWQVRLEAESRRYAG